MCVRTKVPTRSRHLRTDNCGNSFCAEDQLLNFVGFEDLRHDLLSPIWEPRILYRVRVFAEAAYRLGGLDYVDNVVSTMHLVSRITRSLTL